MLKISQLIFGILKKKVKDKSVTDESINETTHYKKNSELDIYKMQSHKKDYQLN